MQYSENKSTSADGCQPMALFGFVFVDHAFDAIGGVQNGDSSCVTGFSRFSSKCGKPMKRRSI